MTIKELYEKAIEGGYENLPLYVRVYGSYSHIDMEMEADFNFIRVENNKVIFI